MPSGSFISGDPLDPLTMSLSSPTSSNPDMPFDMSDSLFDFSEASSFSVDVNLSFDPSILLSLPSTSQTNVLSSPSANHSTDDFESFPQIDIGFDQFDIFTNFITDDP